MTFEQSLSRLDEIIDILNRGDATLDESLSLYEEGTKLLHNCATRLGDAHARLELLGKEPETKA